jgi:hypothetical protein
MNAIFRFPLAPRRTNQLSDLGYPEQLLLRSIRLWIFGYRLNNSSEDRLAKAFECAGIKHGRQRFEEFMVAMTAGASRSLGIHCACHDGISDDEHQLLDILRLSQPGFGTGQCRFFLEDLLTGAGLPIAAVKAQALAFAFTDEGYKLVGARADTGSHAAHWTPTRKESGH